MLVSARELAVRQFLALDEAVRLVVLHPGFSAQHVILESVLQHPTAVYVRFEGSRLTRDQMQQQLDAALELQVNSSRPDHLRALVLDECDRALRSEFDQFLPDVLSRLDVQRVIVLSRLVPDCVVRDQTLRGQTCFIPTEKTLMLWDYARQEDTEQALLEVRALGRGRVLLNGRTVESWDGLLPRLLFFYLVDRGMTTRSEIFETFWPTLSTREATNVFHVTKRKISEVLGVDLTVYWSGFYHVSPRIQLSYDAALFSEMVQGSAVVESDESAALLRRAIGLYRGDFLTWIDMKWTQKRRQELSQTYAEALIALAKLTEKQGNPQQALGLYLRAATTNRQREDLAHSIMRLYRELGMRADAVTIYTLLESALKQQLGVAPAPQLQELAAAIRAEMGTPA